MDCATIAPHTLAYQAECKHYTHPPTVATPLIQHVVDQGDDTIPTSLENNTLYNLGQLVVTTLFGNELATTEILLYCTIGIVSILPIYLGIRKSIQTLGLFSTFMRMNRLLVIVYLQWFLCTYIGLDYFWAYVNHLGHPALYGPHPPMESLTHAWFIITWYDMISITVRAFRDITIPWIDYLLLYTQLIERATTVLYWKNLTCLTRVVVDLMVEWLNCFITSDIIKAVIKLVCNGLVILHMLFYIFVLGKHGNVNVSEAATTSWYQIPDTYQLFACYQLTIITFESILYLYKLHTSIKQTAPIKLD